MQDIKFFTSPSNSPCFNLAMEEYFLTAKKDSYIMLWQNSPSVIIGAFQNAHAEVNLAKAESLGVKVVRRITGGGAVYHDLGNLCYTLITPNDGEEIKKGFESFSAPVIEFLQGLGVKATLSGRNDLTIADMKISGNAQVSKKGRTLIHGTLLFDTDLSALASILTPDKLKLQSKGIKSVKARVTNIKEHLKNSLSVKEFFDKLSYFFRLRTKEYQLTKEDEEKIKELADGKYASYDWNIGVSPRGKISFKERFSFGALEIRYDIVNGVIENASVGGDFFAKRDIKELEAKLTGVKAERKEVSRALSDICEFIDGADGEEIAQKLFE